jgi:5,10-methylenetetrahydromethanopterin reductase
MAWPTDILSAYALPGRSADSRLAITHAIEAERIGLGSIWASERWEGKEGGALCGAISQITKRIRIVAGLIHFTGRHPLAIAGLGATMQRLSDNRFVMGIGRSNPERLKKQGFPVFNLAHLRASALMARRLWAGEKVSYDGVLGKFEEIALLQLPETPPPLVLGAVGPKGLALGGEVFDGVVLHPFLTPEAVARSAKIIRDAAAGAGRDPGAVKVTACLVMGPDFLTEAELASAVYARAMTYFRGGTLGPGIAEANGWDPAPLARVAAERLVGEPRADSPAEMKRFADAVALLPPEWIAHGAAVGSVEHCAARLHDYRRAGADEILIHGTTPERLESVVRAYKAMACA